MENINETLAVNILEYRKKCGYTQEELANKLGVTYQAISKWETAKSAPDIAFLPRIARLFSCSIDALFSRQSEESTPTVCTALPWKDDDTIRAVICRGRTILKASDRVVDQFTFELTGEAKNVKSDWNITVKGNVSGGCNAGHNVNCEGDVIGGCNVGHSLSCKGDISGGCNSGNSISCGGNLSGGCNAVKSIECKGSIRGNVRGTYVSVGGDIHAETVKGQHIQCKKLECGEFEGKVDQQP